MNNEITILREPLLGDLLGDKNPAKAGWVFEAMMKMDKIDIKDLKRAYDRK